MHPNYPHLEYPSQDLPMRSDMTYTTSDELGFLSMLQFQGKTGVLRNLLRLYEQGGRTWEGRGMSVDGRRVIEQLRMLLREAAKDEQVKFGLNGQVNSQFFKLTVRQQMSTPRGFCKYRGCGLQAGHDLPHVNFRGEVMV